MRLTNWRGDPRLIACLRLTVGGHTFGLNVSRRRPYLWARHWGPDHYED